MIAGLERGGMCSYKAIRWRNLSNCDVVGRGLILADADFRLTSF